jgi:hypothetical protein
VLNVPASRVLTCNYVVFPASKGFTLKILPKKSKWNAVTKWNE